MYLKIHKRQNQIIVAACDENLIGRVIKEGEKILDLKVYSDFYKGEKATKEDLKSVLEHFSSLNLVGKHVIETVLELKVINPEDVKYINKVPYVQVYFI